MALLQSFSKPSASLCANSWSLTRREANRPSGIKGWSRQRMTMSSSMTWNGWPSGTVYIPSTIGDLDRAFVQIAADLAQQYVLSYYASSDINDGRFRAISLRVMTRPNMRVRARKGYYAPKLGINAPPQERQPGKLLIRLLTRRQ